MRKNQKNTHNLLYDNLSVNIEENLTFGYLVRSVIIMIDFISNEKFKITSSNFLMIHKSRNTVD